MCSSRRQSHLNCHCRMLPLQQYPSEYQRHYLIFLLLTLFSGIIIISIIIYQLSFSFCQFFFVFVSSITTQQFNNNRTVQYPHKQFETCGKRVNTRFHPPLTVMFCALTRALSVYLVYKFFSGPSYLSILSAYSLFRSVHCAPDENDRPSEPGKLIFPRK